MVEIHYVRERIDTRPKVSIVTPIHNRIEHTLRYLASLRACSYPEFDVVIIDDGSTDGSAEIIRERFPDTTVLEGDGSLWWTRATNVGVRHALDAGSQYVLTLNNDVEVDRDLIASLVRAARDSPGAVVGSKVNYLSDPDRVWFFGAYFDHATGDIALAGGLDSEFSHSQRAQMLTGMGMMIPRETFDAVGLFDADAFPHYLADSDFSLRAKACGHELIVDPASKVYADVEAAWIAERVRDPRPGFVRECLFSIRSQYNVRFRARFYRRHWGPGYVRALVRLYGLTVSKLIARHYLLRLVGRRHRRRMMTNPHGRSGSGEPRSGASRDTSSSPVGTWRLSRASRRRRRRARSAARSRAPRQ